MNGELDVSDALIGLGQTTRLRIVKKTVVNFEVSETEQAPKVPLWFDAVIEAVHPRRLLVKPEGQREWKWWDMRSTQRLELHWEIEDTNGARLRVMSRQNWSQAGYWQYELIEGPVP